jgi:transcriptional regulator with XRE-family HTH domain
VTLREYRESKGWTLRDAGTFFGWAHSRQRELENSMRSPTLRTVDYIARKTGGQVARLDWPEEEP